MQLQLRRSWRLRRAAFDYFTLRAASASAKVATIALCGGVETTLVNWYGSVGR
jgi:hypothetical protein